MNPILPLIKRILGTLPQAVKPPTPTRLVLPVVQCRG